jgi:glycosyltransferase involved in cell wall biosynthesis
MDDYPLARWQAVWAARHSAFHIAVSRSVRDEIAHFTGVSDRLRVIPNGVNTQVFRPADDDRALDLNEILFAGAVRHVKGLDILLKALRILLNGGRDLKLTVVGEPFFREYRKDCESVHALARELDLETRVQFVGGKFGHELVERMQNCGVLVLPSRKESLGMVLAEAIACGTPVVATRCGGPEDIVTDEVGALSPPEDPAALAWGIASVLDRRSKFNRRSLHEYIDQTFSWEAVGRQTLALYSEAIAQRRGAPAGE